MMNDSQTSSTQHTASTGRSCAHSSTLALSPYSSDSSSPTSNQRMEDPLPLLSERAAAAPAVPPPDGGLGSRACRRSQERRRSSPVPAAGWASASPSHNG